MPRKNTYKMVCVVETVDAPCEYSGRIYTYEKLSCGHYHQKPEITETAKKIRALFVAISGEPQKRRCHQCVSGIPSVPRISASWVAKQANTASTGQEPVSALQAEVDALGERLANNHRKLSGSCR